IEFGLELLDRNSVAGKREVAAQAQWTNIALRGVGPPFEPPRQRSGIGRVDLRRPRKRNAVIADGETPAEPHLGQTGCAEFQTIQAPSACISGDLAAQILQAISAESHLIDADAKLHRQ